jgi:hypothetical protein
LRRLNNNNNIENLGERHLDRRARKQKEIRVGL